MFAPFRIVGLKRGDILLDDGHCTVAAPATSPARIIGMSATRSFIGSGSTPASRQMSA